MKKIDIHAHTTNRKLEGVVCEHPNLENLEKEMEKYNVEKTIVLASYFPHKGTGISNFRLLNWIQGKKEFEMFGSLDFDYFYFQGLNELSELVERKLMKGIKIYTCYQNIDLKSDKLKNVLNLAEEHLLPVMFHTGYSYSCMSKCGKVSYTELVGPKDLEFLTKDFPKVNFIFSHLGKPFLDDLIRVVKNNNNVYSDNSGLISSMTDENELGMCVSDLQRFLYECGPEKLLFGTDFPVQSHEDSVYMIDRAMEKFSQTDGKKVYYNNARRILK